MTNNKKSRVQETADRLYHIIIEERAFKEGERLPNEFKLATSLNVGRSTLREAIAYLKEKGIIESRKGSGTYVVDTLPVVTTATDLEDVNIVFHLRDLIELRLINEPAAAALAVLRASDQELESIILQCDVVTSLIETSQNRIEAEQILHELIFKATQNEFLINLIPYVQQSIDETISSKRSIGKLATDTEIDLQILQDAFKQRDPIASKNAMEIHLHHIIAALNLNQGKYPLY